MPSHTQAGSILTALKPQLILFDLDGTLIDSVPDLAAATDQMLIRLGREPAGEAQVRQWVGNGAPMLVKRALAGRTDVAAADQDQIVFEQAYPYFVEAYDACACQSSRLYPGVMDSLRLLQQQKVTLGLITNKPERFTLPLLRHFQLAPFFSLVLSGDSLAEKKPHPQPLRHAMDYYATDPKQCLMVGDSKSDVAAARAAGIKVACVSYGYNHGEDISRYSPDWVIDSLLELQ